MQSSGLLVPKNDAVSDWKQGQRAKLKVKEHLFGTSETDLVEWLQKGLAKFTNLAESKQKIRT